VRGNKIGVFKKGNKELKYVTTISKISTPQKLIFSPTRAMLHEADTSLLLLNELDPKKIFKMDLNRGEVVEEYNTEKLKENTIDIIPENKFAQIQSSNKTFLALNRAGIFTIDPRVGRHSQILKNRTFQYTNTKSANLTCAAPTEKGHVVIGTKSGEIKFFSANSLRERPTEADIEYKPRAMNTLPGLGDEITAIDVTRDGKWVLATCKDYLIVIPTVSNDVTAFDSPFGSKKPHPFRLALQPKDAAKVGEVKFTPAKFNYAYDGSESRICTSTGRWLISWNFKQVIKTVKASYTMTQCEDNVVASDFMTNSDSRIVVTLPDDVQLARTSKQ